MSKCLTHIARLVWLKRAEHTCVGIFVVVSIASRTAFSEEKKLNDDETVMKIDDEATMKFSDETMMMTMIMNEYSANRSSSQKSAYGLN